MKKIIIVIALFFAFMIPSLKARAYSQELANEVNEKFFEYGVLGYPEGQSLRTDVLDGIMNYWELHPDKNLLIFAYSNYAQGSIYIGDNLYVDSGVVYGGNGKRWTSSQWNSNGWSFNTVNETTGNFGGSVYNNSYYDFGTYIENNIDYENPYYDPFMKIPEYEVKYNMVDTGDTAPMPLIIGLKNADSNLYVEAVCVNYMPSVVLVEWQNYKAMFSRKFEQHNLIPHESQILSTDVSSDYIGNALSVAWLQDVTSFPVSEVSFSNGIGSDATSIRAYNNMVDLYDTGRQIGCFYGNNTEIYIRYFRIDELGRFVVSSWRTWSSQYSDSFGVELPSYYKTLETASGYENTSSDTSIIISPTTSPDNVNPSNQTGEKKGSPITINIGQNVPNYPDYPTIASYNLDNLLVSAIDNIKGLSSFFSGFVGFCTATFAWIPVQIWQIIAIGFALSIVVMFLKIL